MTRTKTTFNIYYRYGQFDRENDQHMQIMSLCHQLQWQKPKHKRLIPDIEKLGHYIKHKSGIGKPLNKMDSCELNRLINQLNAIIRKIYK